MDVAHLTQGPGCRLGRLASIVATLGLLFAPAHAEPAPQTVRAVTGADRFDEARALIERTLEDGKVPSITVGVIQDGAVLWEEGFGWADREREVRATPHTPYSLASITKPITATAAMRLAETGRLNLDAPIETYLGGLRLREYAGAAEGVTVRRILSHSAGLPTYGRFLLDGSTPADTAEILGRYGIIVYPPGSRYEYSNIGMKALESAIETVTGQAFGDHIRDSVFAPLGMRRSALYRDPAWAAEAATRYDASGKPMSFYTSDHPGSGDVWSSAHDLLRFAAFHLGTPLPDQERILTPESVETMQVQVSAPPGKAGLGWHIGALGGEAEVLHYGGQPGVRAVLALYPRQKMAVVVLMNSDAPAPLDAIRRAIARAAAPELGAEVRTPVPAGPPSLPSRPEGRWVGAVSHPEGEESFSLDFQADGDIHVRFGQHPTLLDQVAVRDGVVTGQFYGKLDTRDTAGLQTDFWLTLVPGPDGQELIGQLIAFHQGANQLFTLPSFVRLRPEPQPGRGQAPTTPLM